MSIRTQQFRRFGDRFKHIVQIVNQSFVGEVRIEWVSHNVVGLSRNLAQCVEELWERDRSGIRIFDSGCIVSSERCN
jgi:hypothetical protein